MKNLLIIGDSLACPRPWVGIGSNETYGSRIQQALSEKVYVISLARGSMTTRDYVTDSFIKQYVCSGSVSYLVIQLGIVDCAPRLMTVFERFIGFALSKNGFGKLIFGVYTKWKSKHRMFFTRWFPHVLVELEEYRSNLDSIVVEYTARNPIEKIILVNIAYPGRSMAEKSWGILENIGKYNEVIASLRNERNSSVSVIDLFGMTKDNQHWITKDDGHHITVDAHKWISSQIIKCIQE